MRSEAEGPKGRVTMAGMGALEEVAMKQRCKEVPEKNHLEGVPEEDHL